MLKISVVVLALLVGGSVAGQRRRKMESSEEETMEQRVSGLQSALSIQEQTIRVMKQEQEALLHLVKVEENKRVAFQNTTDSSLSVLAGLSRELVQYKVLLQALDKHQTNLTQSLSSRLDHLQQQLLLQKQDQSDLVESLQEEVESLKREKSRKREPSPQEDQNLFEIISSHLMHLEPQLQLLMLLVFLLVLYASWCCCVVCKPKPQKNKIRIPNERVFEEPSQSFPQDHSDSRLDDEGFENQERPLNLQIK